MDTVFPANYSIASRKLEERLDVDDVVILLKLGDDVETVRSKYLAWLNYNLNRRGIRCNQVMKNTEEQLNVTTLLCSRDDYAFATGCGLVRRCLDLAGVMLAFATASC
ncbi:hypothetical protein Tdes44962_MAKER06087 [Teratosphaeria destructans]|uniref:Uncharacterized protein n=1 Tax=Teratosphaeria destructans TaxID=418781 RepID=A0A9W7SII6_9PEZI|nr:hypothetical protein Tdes44962_MAKER06087 [Teratosphaeria destructans]